MARHVDYAMESEEDGGDQGRDAKPLVRSFAQRKYTPKQQPQPGKNEEHRRPASLHTKPEPIAFGMDCAGAG